MAETVTRKPYTPEQKAQALWMYDHKWQPSEIATDVGANVSTVYAWIKAGEEGKLNDLPTFVPDPLLAAKTAARNGTQPLVLDESPSPGTSIEPVAPSSNGVAVPDDNPITVTAEIVNVGRVVELEAQLRAALAERDAAHQVIGVSQATITELEGRIADMERDHHRARGQDRRHGARCRAGRQGGGATAP